MRAEEPLEAGLNLSSGESPFIAMVLLYYCGALYNFVEIRFMVMRVRSEYEQRHNRQKVRDGAVQIGITRSRQS